MKASVCVGTYASTPYYFESLGTSVFCMEELCYILKENAFLLDEEILSNKLIEWIRLRCGVTELAKELYKVVNQKGSLSMFVTMILEFVGLYEDEIISQVAQTFKKGSGLTAYQRRKLAYDNFLKHDKYMTAVYGYDRLLKELEEYEILDDQLYSQILHNKGVGLAAVMSYEVAAECFKEAYEVDGNLDSYFCMLAVKRIDLPEEDYVAYVASINGKVEMTLDLERRLDRLNQEWIESELYTREKQRIELRANGNKTIYYEETDKLLQNMKNDYRKSVNG